VSDEREIPCVKSEYELSFTNWGKARALLTIDATGLMTVAEEMTSDEAIQVAPYLAPMISRALADTRATAYSDGYLQATQRARSRISEGLEV
jgi:hypothetical protein